MVAGEQFFIRSFQKKYIIKPLIFTYDFGMIKNVTNYGGVENGKQQKSNSYRYRHQ